MAGPEGTNGYLYFGPLLERYLADPSIFQKALQALSYFQKHSDFPFNEREVSDTIGKLLGRPLEAMSRSLSWVPDMEWPSGEEIANADWTDHEEGKDLVQSADPAQLDGFRRELEAFATLVKPVIFELYDPDSIALAEPFGLVRIRARKGGEYVAVNLSRNDGTQFELRMTRPDLDFLQDTLKQITEDAYGA